MYWLESLSSKNFLRLSSPWVQEKKYQYTLTILKVLSVDPLGI